MASSSSSLSACSGWSLSPAASSSSLSLHSRNVRPRTLPPRRGQIKAAIFASIFASIKRLLRASKSDDSANGANSKTPSARRSDFRVEVEGMDFELSARSSNLSGSTTPASPSTPSTTPASPSTPFCGPRATIATCMEEKDNPHREG